MDKRGRGIGNGSRALISLAQASIPAAWKVHKIIPIFKSGDKTSVKNYRPIALMYYFYGV